MANDSGMTLKFNKAAEKKILAAGDTVMTRVMEEMEVEAVQRSPYKTGTNRRSIAWKKITGAVWHIFTQSGYGAHLELGTGLFGRSKERIRPKTKKALFWPGAPHPFASVKGMRAQPYLRPAFNAVKRRIRKIIDGVVT